MKVNNDENTTDIIALLQSSETAPTYPLTSLLHRLELVGVLMDATA